MKRISQYVGWIAVMMAALSLTACSGNGENTETKDESPSLVTEAASEILQTEAESESGTEAETEPETEAETEPETEAETEPETETETESVFWTEEAMTEDPSLPYHSTPVSVMPDSWSVPETTVKDVPKDLLSAALTGNKAIYTYLLSEQINYEYYSSEDYKGYAFLLNPVQLLGYEAYGAVRYDASGYSEEPEMMFLIMPGDEEAYEEVLGSLKKNLEKHSSNQRARMIAAPNGEGTDIVHAAQEYIVDGKACYLIEGYRSNGNFFRFDRFGFEEETQADQMRYQGECDKCLVLMSRAGLNMLSDYASVYDLDRYVRYEDSYWELTDEESEEGLFIYYESAEYAVDEYSAEETIEGHEYCYYGFDSLDYELMDTESEEELLSLVKRLDNDTRNLIRFAGRLEQMDGYKGAYQRLLGIAAVLIRRGETDAASGIVSYLEEQWKKEDKAEKTAAFGDDPYYPLSHNERLLKYLQDTLKDKKECSYLNTIWRVRISAPYQYGTRDVTYGSERYEKECKPLVDELVELKDYRNAPLYLQSLLQPFLRQMILERNTDAAEEILSMMEVYFPACGFDEVTQAEMDSYRRQIETIKEEEAYKADKRAELNKAAEGDTVSFGTQDENELEWIILSRQEDKVMLLLKSSFGPGVFGEQQTEIRYMESEIRTTLERWFYYTVFSSAQRQMILPFTLQKDGTYLFGGSSNHFHLLGTKEVKEYLPEKEDRILEGEDGKPAAWWLRTSGSRPGFVRYVDSDGTIVKGGTPCVKEMEVRPIIWVDCSEN